MKLIVARGQSHNFLSLHRNPRRKSGLGRQGAKRSIDKLNSLPQVPVFYITQYRSRNYVWVLSYSRIDLAHKLMQF